MRETIPCPAKLLQVGINLFGLYVDWRRFRFPERARKFPGLVNGCTINWFLSWPAEALVAVSHGFIGNAPIECSAEVRITATFYVCVKLIRIEKTDNADTVSVSLMSGLPDAVTA